MRPRPSKPGRRVLLALALALLGCDGDGPASATASKNASMTDPSTAAPALRVRIATAEIQSLAGAIHVPGVVHPFQKATVAAKIPGRVAARLVEPGDLVAQGDPMLRLDETDLDLAVEEARISARLAEVDLADARREFERAEELRRQKTISTAEMDARQTALDRARAARARAEVNSSKAQQALTDATVRAPFDGLVEEVQADVGEYLQPGALVATVVDFSRARIRAGVTATEAAQLTPGQPAELAFDTLGGTHIAATVRSVARTPDAGSGTYAIELWLDAPDPRLRAGMIGEVHLRRRPGASHPVVPRSAILRREGRMTLFVVTEEADGLRARERVVRSGRTDGDRVEILDGAGAGEHVVVDGHFALGDGVLVAIDNELD